MARIVRKVSNKAVKGQKRERTGVVYSKKFWIIIATVLVLLIAAGITIPLVINKNNSSTSTVEVDDYFGQEQKYNGNTVKFTKMTYQGVKLHINESSDVHSEYTFVFAASLDNFYPVELIDENDKDLKNEKHEQVFKLLKELQYNIDLVNEAAGTNKVNLYIVDTSAKDGNSSNYIFTDTSFKPNENETEDLTELFFLYTIDGLITQPKGTSLTTYGDNFTTGSTIFTAVNGAIQYVKTL